MNEKRRALEACEAILQRRAEPIIAERVGKEGDDLITVMVNSRIDGQAPLEARGIVHAAIFGSVARGDESEVSDVDVIVTPAFAPI